jgi:hypothetical protein
VILVWQVDGAWVVDRISPLHHGLMFFWHPQRTSQTQYHQGLPNGEAPKLERRKAQHHQY